MSLVISYYCEKDKEKWDDFVINQSMNGLFLQTRKFIEYHQQGKYKDCSICIKNGNALVGVVLGCEIIENGKKIFFSHKGTTYGGFCLSYNVYNTTQIERILEEFHDFLKKENFQQIVLKIVPPLYQKKNSDLIDYFLYKNNYSCYSELNFYLDLNNYRKNIVSQYSKGKRRDYRYSLENNLVFCQLEKERIKEFYRVLQLNQKKLNIKPVHTLDELMDLKYNRFEKNIYFYGVMYEDELIAGSMVFVFDDRVFHTQYLASNPKFLYMFPMEFLITNLIQKAIERKIRFFSFGISTEQRGKYLNNGLSRFKEGFGAEYSINRSYQFDL